MWIKSSGEITENTLQITTASCSHVVAQGDYCAISDAGLYAEAETLWNRIEQEVETIEFILLTQVNFSLVGGVPFLRTKAPHLRLVAGREATELLKDKKTTKELYKSNKLACEAAGIEMDISPEDWHKQIQVDMTLSDGESLSLGDGVDVVLVDSPGHAVDSVSYYVKPDGALIAGNLLGHYGGRDLVTPAFANEYSTYIASIQKIAGFDVQVLAFPHGGCLTGDLVSKYFSDLLLSSEQYKELFRKRVESGELQEEIARSISLELIGEGRFPGGPFKDAVYQAVLNMVKSSAEMM